MDTLTIQAIMPFSGEEGMVLRGEKLQVGEARGKELIKAGLAKEVAPDSKSRDTTAAKPKAEVVTSKPKPGENRQVKPEDPTPETK